MDIERPTNQRYKLSPQREVLFREAEASLQFPSEVYELGQKFEGLPENIARVTMLDVSQGPGCHYGVKNVFVPIIRQLEQTGYKARKRHIVPVSPETAIIVESSTGNGWVAAFDAAKYLGYDFLGIMPDGMSSENRYKHPDGLGVEILRTPAEKYAKGMSEKLFYLGVENAHRLKRGEKIYVPLNHSISGADITLQTMSEIGRQLLSECKRVDVGVFSMGNGASICSVGEAIKRNYPEAEIIATESFASGVGFNRFALSHGLPLYQELFGIQTEHPALMARFALYGTNVSIGVKLPLQERAFKGNLIDHYFVVADDPVVKAYERLNLNENFLKNALEIPNLSVLPSVLHDKFGNSTLANISVAGRFTEKGRIVVAMAYDGRSNY